MGKRELLLIVAFVIVGAVVYQATAPPPGPNDRGFSVSRLVDHVRREIAGNRFLSETTQTATHRLDGEISEIRVVGYLADEVTVTGENRPDVQTTLRVNSRGYTDEEAKKFADETVLKSDRAANSLVFSVGYPIGRHTGRQRATLIVKVPARMRIRVEARPSRLTITNVASVETTNSGGETTIKQVAGRIAMTHRGGKAIVEDCAALKFNGRGAEVTVRRVRGDASISLDGGGRFRGAELDGPLDVEARNSEVTLDGLSATRGPIRVNAQNGEVTLNDVKADTRVDGRNAELRVTMSGAAPVALYTENGNLTLTPPPSGYKLDALAVEGRITPEAILERLGLEHTVDAETKEARASGSVDGGGATITVRATRGDVIISERAKPM
jgi:Putative adhesin